MLKAQTVRDSGLLRGSAFLRSNGLLVALVVLVALLTIGDPAFLSPTNLANVLGQWAPAGIMAVAATYVIIGRGFDLSVASGFSLCAIVAAGTAAAGYSNEIAFAARLWLASWLAALTQRLFVAWGLIHLSPLSAPGLFCLASISLQRRTPPSPLTKPASIRSVAGVGMVCLSRASC